MKSITQTDNPPFGKGACDELSRIGQGGILEKGSLGRALILFIAFFLVFCLGLLLGGTVMKNKYLKVLDETKEMLQKHRSSVIIIPDSVAIAADFKPRDRWDKRIILWDEGRR